MGTDCALTGAQDGGEGDGKVNIYERVLLLEIASAVGLLLTRVDPPVHPASIRRIEEAAEALRRLTLRTGDSDD